MPSNQMEAIHSIANQQKESGCFFLPVGLGGLKRTAIRSSLEVNLRC